MELDVEGEASRGHLHPALDGPPLGYGVEARVDLDRLEALGIPGEAVAGREAGRVPLLDEAGVGPARGTDVDGATHGATVPAPHTRWSSAPRDPGRARRKTATFSRFMVSLRVGHAPRPGGAQRPCRPNECAGGATARRSSVPRAGTAPPPPAATARCGATSRSRPA